MADLATENELQDLSLADAQELQSFLEKRRWFEDRLKVLENLPSIYPFVQPVLVPPTSSSTSIPEYECDAPGAWTLPSLEDIQRWQSERDSLEEEILAFDGGDLARMKRKTRAATLLPLTPPSTHLVSITLALIVLIDRLMILLRHRADLLELTSLRIQWDNMRWQIMLETGKVRMEIDHIAKVKGRWIPPGKEGSTHDSCLTPTKSTGTNDKGSPLSKTTKLPLLSSISSTLSELSHTSITPSKSTRPIHHSKRDSISSLSSLVVTNSPKRNFHLPLLHSSIVNLEIRQKSLSSTLLIRSGKLLDRMIDLAIPLKHLGGMNGPGEENGEGGAVPDELLDIQDDMENRASDLSDHLNWCKALEEQWKRADEHYLSSIRAQEAGRNSIDCLRSALSKSPSSEAYARLASLLSEGQNHLPMPIDQTFPRPSHSSYPDQDQHTLDLITTLTAAREEGRDIFYQGTKGLQWYSRLLDSAERMSAAMEQVERLRQELSGDINFLALGDESHQRPDMESLELTGGNELWMTALPGRLSSAHTTLDRLEQDNQRLAVEVLRFRKEKSVPSQIKEIIDDVDISLLKAGEAMSEAAAQAIAQAKMIIVESEKDAAILPLLKVYIGSTGNIRKSVDSLRQKIDDIDHTTPSSHISSMLEETRDLSRSHVVDALAQSDRLLALLKNQQRPSPNLQNRLTTTSADLERDIRVLCVDIDRLRTIAEERETVGEIEQEAESFINRIIGIQRDLEGFVSSSGVISLIPDATQTQVNQVDVEVQDWIRQIVTRMTFTGGTNYEAQSGGDTSSETLALRSPTRSASAPPMTPPATPPYNMLRVRVNGCTARVQGAVDHLQQFTDKAVRDRARRLITEAMEPIDTGLAVTAGRLARMESQLEESKITFEGHEQDSTEALAILAGIETSLAEVDNKPPLVRWDHQTNSLVAQVDELPSDVREGLSEDRRYLIERKTSIAVLQNRFQVLEEGIANQRYLLWNVKGIIADIQDDNDGQEEQLAEFHKAVTDADEFLSRLLETLDGYKGDDDDQVQVQREKTLESVQRVHQSASKIKLDVRVTAEVERIQTAWLELDALVEETLHPETASLHGIDNVSEVLSVTSAMTTKYHQAGNRPSRHALDPFTNRAQPSEPRHRAISDTPTRVRIDSMTSGLPRLRKSSMGLPEASGRISSPQPQPGQSALPRPSRLSLSSMTSDHPSTPKPNSSIGRKSSIGRRPRGSARPSLGSSMSSTRSRQTYVADPKSKLDMAVGKIVNTLKVNVPIRPVGLDSTDEWKDQSGKYWIGAEGRAKLCFCRILRSKTVMVRVGGGWVELSKFLMDHFADSLVGWDPLLSGQIGIGIGSSTPVPITSALLTTPKKSTVKPIPPNAKHHGHSDKVNGSIGPTSTRVDSIDPDEWVTPNKVGVHDVHDPPSSGPSPLVPLHFIRKASESPPARRKEKEKFGLGRRSILGRSPSGNVNVDSSPEKDTS